MLGMGATLDLSDFGQVVRRPLGLLVALAAQWLLVPTLAWAFIVLFDLSPGWAVGLVLVAAVPGGASSNLFTFLARGDTPLSIATTLVTTAGCVLSAPLLLSLIARDHLPPDFVFPAGAILSDVALYLLLPLAVGMALRKTQHAEFFSKLAIRGSLVTLVLIVINALGTGQIELHAYGWLPPARIFLFAALLAFGTPHLVRLLGFRDVTATAIGIEVTVRNVAIALMLMRFFFPDQAEQGQALFTCLFYSGAAFPLAVPVMWRARRGMSPAFGRAPRSVIRTPKVAPPAGE